MPGIWASEYALPLLLLSFNGAGGILYGGLWIFVLLLSTMVTAMFGDDDDFSAVNLVNALFKDDVEDDDSDNGVNGDGDGDIVCDWLSNGLPVFTGAAIDSLPADNERKKSINK